MASPPGAATSSTIASDSPTGSSGRRALIAALAARCAGGHAGAHAGEVLAQHHVACPVALDAGRLGRGGEGRPLELDDELRQVRPRQHLGQIRLVEGHSELDAVAEAVHDHPDVAREECGCLRVEPRPAFCEPMRRREVVERDDRGEAARAASVRDGLVVRERVVRELAFDGLDACPLDREPVGVQPHRGHEIEV